MIKSTVYNDKAKLGRMYGPRFPALNLFDMCQPDFGKDANDAADISPVAGYFDSNNKVIRSGYNVPLKHGIPLEYDQMRNRDGHKKCFLACEKEWSLEDTRKFEKLVKYDYGYRLFLDDLPSATAYLGHKHYDELIPLGYYPKSSEREPSKDSDGREEIRPTNIFNHLDITVTVHETTAA